MQSYFRNKAVILFSIRKYFNGGRIFRRRHARNFLKLTGKIMNGCIADEIGYLGKVVVVFPNQLFGKFYFQAGEIVNDPALVIFPEQLLQLGTPDEIVPADTVNGKVFPDMLFQISSNPVIKHVVIFLFDGFYGG